MDRGGLVHWRVNLEDPEVRNARGTFAVAEGLADLGEALEDGFVGARGGAEAAGGHFVAAGEAFAELLPAEGLDVGLGGDDGHGLAGPVGLEVRGPGVTPGAALEGVGVFVGARGGGWEDGGGDAQGGDGEGSVEGGVAVEECGEGHEVAGGASGGGVTHGDADAQGVDVEADLHEGVGVEERGEGAFASGVIFAPGFIEGDLDAGLGLEFADDGDADAVITDAHGTPLADGDAVILIKDLKVKGSSLVLKKGTKVKSIRLVGGDHDVDCKIDGIGNMSLKSEFLKKA